MNSDAFRDLVLKVLLGEASPEERARVEALRGQDPACASVWDELSGDHDRLRRAVEFRADSQGGGAPLPPDRLNALLSSLPAPGTPVAPAATRSPERRPRGGGVTILAWFLGTAAAAAAGVLLWLNAAREPLRFPPGVDATLVAYLTEPWVEARERVPRRVLRSSGPHALLTPGGTTALAEPVLDWVTSGTEVFAVEVFLGDAPVARAEGVRPPLAWAALRAGKPASADGRAPALMPGETYTVRVVPAGRALAATTSTFSTRTALHSSTEGTDPLAAAMLELSRGVPAPAEALQWLRRLPASAPTSREALRLEAWALGALGQVAARDALLARIDAAEAAASGR